MENLLGIVVPVWNQEKLIIRALESIPKRNDIKIIIIDNCSTDKTFENITEWKIKNNNNFYEIIALRNAENIGVGASMNIAYKLVDSKYLYVLDSDDYILSEEFNDLLNNLNDYANYDIIRIKNELNDGTIDTKPHTAGWSYLLKNRFSIEYPKLRKQGDWEYWKLLINDGATYIESNIVCYHYNYPREGSIVWNYEHGLIDWKGDPIE